VSEHRKTKVGSREKNLAGCAPGCLFLVGRLRWDYFWSSGADAHSGGFTGGEWYVGINCKDNASPWQAR